MLRSSPVRVLDDRDLPAVLEVLGRNPVENVFVQSRVESGGLDPWRLGAEMWGFCVDGTIEALCYSGANLVPAGAGEEAIAAFADRGRRQGRRCSSIVGPHDMVEPLWHALEPSWGGARDIRGRQPLMVLDDDPLVDPDPAVRRVRVDELETLLPASIAMFTEEVGVSPVAADGGQLYRARVTELVQAGRSFARIEDGRVVFKAEVGAATRAACQIQGVWVEPSRRGEGLSITGMAAVARACRADIAPIVSLYVNDFNVAARRCYERVGFRTVGTFMSVLF